MLQLKGTHGTCKTHADKIAKEGFQASKIGRAGGGAYFWTYETYHDFARKLAFYWWKKAEKDGSYSHCKEKICHIIYVRIETENEEYLDCTQQAVEDAILQLTNYAAQGVQGLEDEDIYKIYEAVIEQLESRMGCYFNVIRAKVSLPIGKLPEKKVMASPSCYVVRRQLDRIFIEANEQMDNSSESSPLTL